MVSKAFLRPSDISGYDSPLISHMSNSSVRLAIAHSRVSHLVTNHWRPMFREGNDGCLQMRTLLRVSRSSCLRSASLMRPRTVSIECRSKLKVTVAVLFSKWRMHVPSAGLTSSSFLVTVESPYSLGQYFLVLFRPTNCVKVQLLPRFRWMADLK